MSDNSINNIPLPTTPEETAYRLFELVCEHKTGNLKQENILPLFAKCMLAVKTPHDFLKLEHNYKITQHLE